MSNNSLDFMKDVMAAPLGQLISSIGEGVAHAQAALDAGSLAQTLALYNTENNDELSQRLREVGYQPTFYVIPETEVEAQVSFSLSIENTSQDNLPFTSPMKAKMYATPVNAGNINKFNLNVGGIAKLKFKIVPVPPPSEVAEMRVVPNLVGKEFTSETLSLINQLGLEYTNTTPNTTTGKIATQKPEGGTIAKIGATVEITIS
jgi:PASTA domain